MNAPKILLAAGSVGTLITVAVVARYVAGAYGTLAGVLVVGVPFAACWVVWRVRPALHPQPQRPREPQVTSPVALAETRQPTRIAA